MEALAFTPHALYEQQRPISADEFERMLRQGLFADEHVELIGGRLVLLMSQGPRHIGRVDWLNALFGRLLAEAYGLEQQRVAVRVQSTTRMVPTAASAEAARTTPEPDLALLRAECAFTGQPVQPGEEVFLIVEVADTSLEQDLGEKARVYAALDVPLLWVLDLPHRRLHVFRGPRPRAAVYEEQEMLETGTTSIETLPELPPVEVETLFLHMGDDA